MVSAKRKVQSAKLGQTIVELLVALGIATLVIIALVSLATTSLSNVTFSRTQGEATRFARDGMEWLRSERDKDWEAFAERAGNTWCLSSLSWPAGAGTCSQSLTVAGTNLRREATLASTSDTKLDAYVRVYWTDSKGDHETRLNSSFTKWR